MLDVNEFYKENPASRPEPPKQSVTGFNPAEFITKIQERLDETTALRHSGYRKVAENDRLKWILAGRAIFTIRNARTGNRFTYSVRRDKKDETLYWVAVLRGPDNATDYTPLGRIAGKLDQPVYFARNKSSRIGEDAQSYKVFAWFFKHLLIGDLPDFIEIWHAGRCCVCGRLLTVPESVEAGIGPECASRF